MTLRHPTSKEIHMNRTKFSRAVAVALLGTALAAGTAPAFSHDRGAGHGGRGFGPHAGQMTEADRAQMRERMQARMAQRLDRMAARLEIKASQQEAWSAYRQARESIFANAPQQLPGPDADAASLTRFRADMAKRRADRMAVMADATAKLQEALEPNQRKVLDEMSRRGGHRGPGAKGGHRGHGDGPGQHRHHHRMGQA
jgi:Spy/CpxP family protein refolding chaperone